MLAGSATPICQKLGYDYPFAATKAELKKGDIAIGNLEGPVARKGTEYTTKRFRFRAAPQSAEALRRAGFSIVTLANNHSMDFGRPALRETLFNLASNGILHVGAGEDLAAARKEAVIQIGTVKIASSPIPSRFPPSSTPLPTVPAPLPDIRATSKRISLGRKLRPIMCLSRFIGARKVRPLPAPIR